MPSPCPRKSSRSLPREPRQTPQLDRLLAQVRALMKRGGRVKLARALGWRINEVSSYLAATPKRKPDAENAVALMHWLAAQEKPKPRAPRLAISPRTSNSKAHPRTAYLKRLAQK